MQQANHRPTAGHSRDLGRVDFPPGCRGNQLGTTEHVPFQRVDLTAIWATDLPKRAVIVAPQETETRNGHQMILAALAAIAVLALVAFVIVDAIGS